MWIAILPVFLGRFYLVHSACTKRTLTMYDSYMAHVRIVQSPYTKSFLYF